MKVVSLIVLVAFAAVSCTYHPPPHKYADMPVNAEIRHKPDKQRKTQRAGISSSDIAGLVIVTAAIAALAKAMGSSDRGNCGDCSGDGVVHSGDPHAAFVIVGKAYRCPVCGGDGHF